APADIVLTGNTITASQKAISIQRFIDWDGTVKTYGGINNIDATGGNIINGISTTTTNLAHLFTIEDAINHKIDEGWRGFVKVKDFNTYVTPLSYITPATTAPSIQRGIDAALATWTVNVAAGTYNEYNITVNKSLSLRGANAGVAWGSRGPESKVTDPNGNTLFNVNSDGVTINGFEITGRLSNNAIYNDVAGHSNVSIVFNNIHDVGNDRGSGSIRAIHYMLGSNVNSSDVVISDNYLNNIGNNTTLAGSADAIWFGSGTNPGSVTTIAIERNIISNVKSFNAGRYSRGIYIGPGTGSIINPAIKDNTVFDFLGYSTYAIVLENSVSNGLVSNNLIYNIISTNNNAAGVYTNVTTGGATNAINNNSFTNVQFGIKNNQSIVVNATCNWWGTNTVAGVASMVTGPVTYDPWLSTGTDNDILLPGFQPVPNSCTGATNLFVNDDTYNSDDIYTTAVGNDGNTGIASAPFRTITKAVNTAVEGTTVKVDAGTFQEQVLIDKTMNIVGVNTTKTIVIPPVTVPGVTTPNSTLNPVICAKNTNVSTSMNVNISKLMIDGNGGRNCDKFVGMLYYASGGTFDDARISGIHDIGAVTGSQRGIAFYADHNSGITLEQNISLTNSMIDDYQKGGLVIKQPGTYAFIDNNSVIWNAGLHVTAPNGIQISGGARATLTNNTVQGNAYLGPGNWTATGILLYNPSTGISVIGNNHLIQNECGIYFAESSGWTVNSNDFNDNYCHIYQNPLVTAVNTYDKTVIENETNPLATNLVYGRIQCAIDWSDVNPVLNASAGTFTENVIINKPLTLNGAGQSSTFVIPALSNPNPCSGASLCPGASNIFLVEADDVTIQNLTADGNNPALTSGVLSNAVDVDARNGIITNHGAGVFNNLKIHDVTVKNIYLRGIYASSGGTFNIHHNTVDNVAGEANSIGIFNFGGSGNINYNTVSRANDAIASNWSKGTTYSHNTVTSSGSGIHTDNQGDGSGTTADLIAYNSVSNSTTYGYGIFVFVPYKNVQVMKNNITGVDVGLSVFGGENDAMPVFAENTVDGTGKVTPTGIYSTTNILGYGSQNQHAGFTNNIIKNCATGIEIEADPGFTNYSYLNYNSITSNTTGVHVTGTGTGVNDLTCNWWGATSNTAVTAAAGTTSPWVTYTPWLINGTDTEPDTTGFQNVANACLGSPIILSAIPTHVTCNEANNGAINLTVTGGGTPYTYAWTASNGGVVPAGQASQEDLTGLVAGTYSVHVTDLYGSAADLQVIITQPVARIVSGYVKYYNNASTPMDHVTINLKQGSSLIYSTTTSSTGTYSFPNVCDGEYTVELLTNTTENPVGGINSTDAAQVNYWFSNHYNIEKVRFFAGDVGTATHDYELLPMDASKIVEYFVTIGNPAQPFPSSWTFWKTNDGTSAQNPSHVLTVAVNGSSLTQNFYALVSGDFNRSFVPGNLKMQGDDLNLNIEGKMTAESGSEIELPVYAGQSMEVGAISMIINLPQEQVEITGVNLLNTNIPVQYTVIGDQLRIGWQSSEEIVLEAGQTMMIIKMKVSGMDDQPVRLFLDGSDLNELADASSEVIEGAILYTPEILTPTGVSVIANDEKPLEFANHPNPFHDKTTFTYSIPKDGDVSLEIYNLLGSKISTVVKEFRKAGDYSVTFNMDLPSAVYIAVLNLKADGQEYNQKIKITSDQK
ncbi:MAG: NosD domain-containing protein, partial [Syntrophothermus sp.]